jgi:hypothetical protein
VKLDYEPRQQHKQELQQELQNKSLYSEILGKISDTALSRKRLSEELGQKTISGQLNKVLLKLIEDRLIEHTIPDKLNHPEQKFRLTERGITFRELVE